MTTRSKEFSSLHLIVFSKYARKDPNFSTNLFFSLGHLSIKLVSVAAVSHIVIEVGSIDVRHTTTSLT
jgi:hypothetical protein